MFAIKFSNHKHDTLRDRVFTLNTIANRADKIRTEHEIITPDQVHSVASESTFVDGKFLTLCLPSEKIAQLCSSLLRGVVELSLL